MAERSSPIVERHELTHGERLGDAMFTGLRLTDGVDVDAIERRYDADVRGRYASDLEPCLESGLVEWVGARLRLTRRGMLLAHEVMAVFV
jgi:oxygen-independent coproporphyrinogen-3 oxidase